MKDFSLIDGSSGSFPDVVAVDCSGPGEVDGFSIVADYLNDSGLGWIQALLNEVGDTPNGTTEADGASQILQAIMKLIYPEGYQSIVNAVYGENGWQRYASSSNFYIQTLLDEKYLVFPIRIPFGFEIDLTVNVVLDPGYNRSGTDRMSAQLALYNNSTHSLTLIDSPVYDSGSTGSQSVYVTKNSFTPQKGEDYFIHIKSGNNSASYQDAVHNVSLQYDFS